MAGLSNIVVVIPPANEPVTVEEVLSAARLDDWSEHDPMMPIHIGTARVAAENIMRRYIVTQTLDAYLDAFPCADDDYTISLPPLQSVTSITYIDADGAEQTLSASLYTVDAVSIPARIRPAYNESWPDTRSQMNAVVVRFVAGYGAATATPQNVKNWILRRVATLWRNEQDLQIGKSVVPLPDAYIDGLLDSEKVYGAIFG